MSNEKDIKKLSPDAVNDEDTKEYKNKEIMEAAFGDEDDDEEIAVAPGEEKEVVEEDKEIVKTVEEVFEEPEEKEIKEEVVEDKKEEKREEPEKESRLELDESVKKALSPYKGSLEEQIKQLVESHNNLLQKLQSYGTVNNVIKELGFEGLKPDELVETMKELKTAAIDMLNNPVVLDIIEGIATGKLSEEFKQDKKTVSDFMPEGELYDAYDAVNDPNSASWQAREKWETWNYEQRKKIDTLLEKVKSKKQSSVEIKEKYEKASKLLQQKLEEVKQFAKDEYDVDEEKFSEFVNSFKSFDTDIIKVAFAVFAKKNGIKNKIDRKLEANSKNKFIEAETPAKEEEIITQDDREKELADAFLDWDANDNVIL